MRLEGCSDIVAGFVFRFESGCTFAKLIGIGNNDTSGQRTPLIEINAFAASGVTKVTNAMPVRIS